MARPHVCPSCRGSGSGDCQGWFCEQCAGQGFLTAAGAPYRAPAPRLASPAPRTPEALWMSEETAADYMATLAAQRALAPGRL